MEATRYRLRLVPGFATPALTYGDLTFGAGTYGQAALPPSGALEIHVIPTTGGRPTWPAWLYHEHDTLPAFGAVLRNGDTGAPSDLTGATATLVLTPCDGRPDTDEHTYPLTVGGTNGTVTRTWLPADLVGVGLYLATIVIRQATNVYSTPTDDQLGFAIQSGGV